MKFAIFFVFLLNLIYAQNNSWIRTNGLQNEYITGLVINSDGDIFAGSYNPGKIYRSTDNGNSWTHLIDLPTIWSLAINDSQHVFAATLGGEGIYRSKDNGNSWHAANNGLSHNTCNNLAFGDSGYVFAATDYGMYRSNDNGNNWALVDSGLPATLMYDVCVSPTGYVFVGTYDMGIYRSVDHGLTWEEKNNGLTNPFIWSLLFTENGILFSGPDAGYIERSLNDGQTWTLLSNGLPNTWFFHVLETNSEECVFVGFESVHGVYFSDDDGNTWIEFNNGFPSGVQIVSLSIDQNDILYAGTNNGIFKTANPTFVLNSSSNLPSKIELFHNYPNPFNSETTIEFQLLQNEKIEIIIFDQSGKIVSKVFSGYLNPGIKKIKWRTNHKLSSGIYYCNIRSEKFFNSIKLLLLK